MSKKVRSEEKWRELVRRYEAESEESSMATFCRGHGIAPSTFYKWKARYGAEGGKFVKVKSSSASRKAYWIKFLGIKIAKVELDV